MEENGQNSWTAQMLNSFANSIAGAAPITAQTATRTYHQSVYGFTSNVIQHCQVQDPPRSPAGHIPGRMKREVRKAPRERIKLPPKFMRRHNFTILRKSAM
jgi:hypothetical protein